jgi:hypothetical protein
MYREEHGNCLFPYIYKENLPLVRWIKRQRFQYKLMVKGKPSAMTDERVKALEELGFAFFAVSAREANTISTTKEEEIIRFECID